LKASSWCSVELGPVELLLNAVKGFIADLAPCAQPMQCRALGSDRVEPQFVVFSRSPRLTLIFGNPPGGLYCSRTVAAAVDVSPSRRNNAYAFIFARLEFNGVILLSMHQLRVNRFKQ
jgi:hypothetical protein